MTECSLEEKFIEKNLNKILVILFHCLILQKIDHLIWEHLLVTVSHFFWLKIDLMVLVIVAFLPAVLFTTSLQKIKLSDYLRVRWRRQKQQQVMIFTWGIFFSVQIIDCFLMVLLALLDFSTHQYSDQKKVQTACFL